MKINAKRIVSARCALAMCAAMLPAAAFAEGDAVPETTAASTTETVGTESDAFDSDDVIAVLAGSEITLQGDATGTGHKWNVYADGGYDVSGIEITSDTSASTVTVKVTKPGIYRVSHSWDTGLAWPMHTKNESFEVKVSAEKLTVSNLEVYVEVPGLPNGETTTLNFTLHYRGTASPSSGGNFDTYFDPIAFSATVSPDNGMRVRIVPETSADKELIDGYYRLDYNTTGASEIWNESDIQRDEAIFFEVENQMIRFCSSGGATITEFEDFSTCTMQTVDGVCTLTLDANGGNAVPAILAKSGSTVNLSSAILIVS